MSGVEVSGFVEGVKEEKEQKGTTPEHIFGEQGASQGANNTKEQYGGKKKRICMLPKLFP